MEFAPAPFTPDEIRVASTNRRIVIVSESPGQSPATRITEFVDGDTERAVMMTSESSNGEPIGETRRFDVSWEELRDHAKFPAHITTIEPEVIETPLGVVDTLRYTVIGDEQTMVFWFAPAFPGMPIRYHTVVEGQVTSATTVIESTALAP